MTVISNKITPCAPARSKCACPECGGLECLCRPRFFAGQLLTEETMNQLDRYIRGRFRMHNLSLHGTGVVNGLSVICDPCGQVTVTKGHAISPCGDDIIVCEDVDVPVCDLIDKCRKCEHGPRDCEPPRKMPDSVCDDLDEEWVLAIKYDERPVRGVLPLRTGVCKSCGCSGCGGGGSESCCCGHGGECGCDACCEPPDRPRAKPRGAPTECEPTVICEGFRFCVYRKPEEEIRDDDDRLGLFDSDGALARRLSCCFEALTGALPASPEITDATADTLVGRRALTSYCCKFRKNLMAYFATHPHTNCEIVGILKRLQCPDPENADGYADAFVESFMTLIGIWLDAIKQCFCLALLPPAPEPVCDHRVSLASIRVTAGECRVLSVCNWTTYRDILVSWPAIGYWLGSLGLFTMLRELLDSVCCSSLADIFEDSFESDDQGGDGTAVVGTETFDFAGQPMSASFDASWAKLYPRFSVSPMATSFPDFFKDLEARGDQRLDMNAVLNASSRRFRLPETGAPLGPTEMANLPETLTMEFVAKPLFQVMSGTAAVVGAAEDGAGKEPAATEKDLAEMRTDLETQRAEIETLKAALKDIGG